MRRAGNGFNREEGWGKSSSAPCGEIEAQSLRAGQRTREELAVAEKGETRCLNEPQKQRKTTTKITASSPDRDRFGRARLPSDWSVCRLVFSRLTRAAARRCAC